MRAMCGTRCEPMLPPAPTTTIFFPLVIESWFGTLILFLRRPAEPRAHISRLRTQSANLGIRPAVQRFGFVMPYAARRALDRARTDLDFLLAARAKDGLCRAGKMIDAGER